MCGSIASSHMYMCMCIKGWVLDVLGCEPCCNIYFCCQSCFQAIGSTAVAAAPLADLVDLMADPDEERFIMTYLAGSVYTMDVQCMMKLSMSGRGTLAG